MPNFPDLETLRSVGPDIATLRPIRTGPDLATLRPIGDGGEDPSFMYDLEHQTNLQDAGTAADRFLSTLKEKGARGFDAAAGRLVKEYLAGIGIGPIAEQRRADEQQNRIAQEKEKMGAENMSDRQFLAQVDNQTRVRLLGPMTTGIRPVPAASDERAQAGGITGAIAGAQNFIAALADFMTSPAGILAAAVPQVAAEAGPGMVEAAHQAMATGFAADMLQRAPEQAKALYTSIKTGDTAGAVEHALGGLLTVAVTKGAIGKLPGSNAEMLARALDASDLKSPDEAGTAPIPRTEKVTDAIPTLDITPTPDLATLAPATAAAVRGKAVATDLPRVEPIIEDPGLEIKGESNGLVEPIPSAAPSTPETPAVEEAQVKPEETPAPTQGPVEPTGGAYEGDVSEKTFRERADALAAKLEGLKSGIRPGGPQTHAFGIVSDLWDRGVSVAQAVIRAGGSIADAIDAFISHVKENFKDPFDETGARRHLFEILSGDNKDPATYGIAARVTEERARRGEIGFVAPGEGISVEDSVARGRELLASGSNPERVVSAFNRNKAVSSDGMAVVRAHGEKLAQVANEAAERFGIDSEQYKTAAKADEDWIRAIKPMQTEWHKIGQAQQGETDIDTGTFHGLKREFFKQTEKDLTPGQTIDAEKIAKGVKRAQGESAEAKTKLNEELKKRTPMDDAEQRAFEAAKKTVRENAVRLAKAEADAIAADKVREMAGEKTIKAAELAAQKATDKTVRENAVRIAKKEEADAIKAADLAKKALEVARASAEKAREAVRQLHRDNATRIAKQKADELNDPAKEVWRRAGEYLDRGIDNFDEVRNKIATDMGMSVANVTRLLTESPRAKYLANEAWKKQQQYRKLDSQAKQWIRNQEVPIYKRALASVPRVMFGLKVGFHGTVALGTHAPMVAFQPRFWKAYVRDFGKMYKMIGSPAYYEMQVQDLLRRGNYLTARRAGLVNDPFQYEDFNSPDTAKYFGALSGMGNRGYSILKILRQDMFDQHWDKLPKSQQFQNMAEAISDGINHATGVVQGSAPKGSNVVLFAPRLMASRVMWLAGDPLRAADTFLRWSKATPEEKYFAVNQIKEKAWVVGTVLSLLALNQGFLSATGSDQRVNFDDPFHSDWLKFKVAGMTASYGNAMLTMARLPVRLYRIRESDGGKLKNLVFPDEDSYTVLGEYGRSQLSPFASLATTLWLKGDWQNRPLPSSDRPVPKRLRQQGIEPYTWPEFFTEQVLPIPAEEAAREVWKHGLGMSEEQINGALKALATIAVMSATGARLTDDVNR